MLLPKHLSPSNPCALVSLIWLRGPQSFTPSLCHLPTGGCCTLPLAQESPILYWQLCSNRGREKPHLNILVRGCSDCLAVSKIPGLLINSSTYDTEDQAGITHGRSQDLTEEQHFPRRSKEGSKALLTPRFGLLVSTTVREHISVVIIHPFHGNLFWQPWKLKIDLVSHLGKRLYF